MYGGTIMEQDVDINALWDALRNVYDPELQIDIVNLGLVYKIDVDGTNVNIDMTMTSPGCPLTEQIVINTQNELLKVKGVSKVNINLIWSPPWSPEMMSDEAKAALGIF
jgi:metal-sulfur cluster biosynthetic enzyme